MRNASKQPALETKNLVKKFGSFRALDDLNLKVETGEIHGFLGPNGSGKSTTIRVLLGLLKKSGGEATLFGQDPWKQATELHKRLAYVPGDVSLWPNLSGGEAIDLLGALRGGLDKKRRADLLKRFELDPKKKFRTYSKGNRQKVALVAALASDVELYILDEPTSGFDPLMEATFQSYVRDLKKQGKTILLSSHILAEVEALCDHVTIIREGKTVETGSLSKMRHLQRTTIIVETKKPSQMIGSMKGVQDFVQKGKKTEFEVEPDRVNEVMRALSQLGIITIVSNPPNLEQLFLKHYGDESSDSSEKK